MKCHYILFIITYIIDQVKYVTLAYCLRILNTNQLGVVTEYLVVADNIFLATATSACLSVCLSGLKFFEVPACSVLSPSRTPLHCKEDLQYNLIQFNAIYHSRNSIQFDANQYYVDLICKA